MPAYFPTNVTSDVASTNLMDALTPTNTTITVTTVPPAAGGTNTATGNFITAIPYPNNNNVTTTTATVIVVHTVVGMNHTISAQLHRVNSAGVIQSSGTAAAGVPVGATNTFNNLDEPTWSTVCSDRLLLRLTYSSTQMSNQSSTIGTNRVGTYLLSSIPHNTGCAVLRKPSWVVSGKNLFLNTASTQVTGFNNAYFSFGDISGTTPNRQQYNRTITFSTDVESTRTVMSTAARISQGAGGFNSTEIYHVNGFDGALNTTKNKVTFATDTQSSPTISFTVERRGATCNLPHYEKSRIYFLGGYSDTLAQYRSDSTYISTATDTATNTTAITAARHVSVGMYQKETVYILGGYTTGDAATNTIYKYVMTTDTASNTSLTETTSNVQGYSFSNTINGYRLNGATVTNTANIKIAYATETKSTSSNGPEAITLYQGVSSTSITTGYLYTGYRSAGLNRLYHKMLYSTETWNNASFTVVVTNDGWVNGTSGV